MILKRNPQYLTPKQMESLKASIERDGFCAPILVRPIDDERYEIISGNHRFMASSELGYTEIHCVVSEMDDRMAKRLAINLNTIHGEPNAELLAPFLAELDDETLGDIHIDDSIKDDLMDFDTELADQLKALNPPKTIDRSSRTHSNATCRCPVCGLIHVVKK